MPFISYQHWHLHIDQDQILWLTIDRQGATVNSLNNEVISELDTILTDLMQGEVQQKVRGVVILSGKSSGFIAGADIEQFITLVDQDQAFDLVRQAQLVMDKLANLKWPTVALIDGFCLGGGLELALSCRYRIAEDGPKTQLGAPEVKLGLHPGWGGTVRLPQLIGVLSAMDLNLSGRSIIAKVAARLGLVDEAVPKRQLSTAARHYILQQPPPHCPSSSQQLLSYPWVRPWVAKWLYKKLASKVNKEHYPAPYAIVDNWVKDGSVGNNAMIQEAKSIAALLVTPTSRNLVRVFFLQARLKALGKEVHFPVKHVHVIGAGVMGGDIAAWCALRGFHVTLQDRMPELLAPAFKRAAALFEKKLKLPRLVQAAMDRLIPDPSGLGVAKADVVIEAVFENLAAKQALYQAIEPHLKPGAVLATNTSSLSLTELGQTLIDPHRLVGVHFFNPVAMMPLVEIVSAPGTHLEAINNAIAFVRGLDRLPLPVKSQPGFLVNRILMPYLMEAMTLLEEHVSPAAIDQAAKDFGMPMGPIELADTVGLDVCLAVANILSGHYNGAIPETLRQMVANGQLGRKSGQGFYKYEKGKPQILNSISSTTPSQKPDITERLIFRLLNESVACWRENIVADADLLDAGMIFGTGFAPFRGGPLHYIRSEGADQLLAKLKILHDQYDERFAPDEGWIALADSETDSSEAMYNDAKD